MLEDLIFFVRLSLWLVLVCYVVLDVVLGQLKHYVQVYSQYPGEPDAKPPKQLNVQRPTKLNVLRPTKCVDSEGNIGYCWKPTKLNVLRPTKCVDSEGNIGYCWKRDPAQCGGLQAHRYGTTYVDPNGYTVTRWEH
jgi:hypothetical protein